MSELPYVELSIFNEKVNEFAKTNFVLKNLFNNPRSNIKSWEDLPPHLKADLFKKVGCKPSFKNINMLENIQLPRSYYQPLFDLLHHEHGLTPLESEMADIIHVVEKIQGKQPGPVWVKASEKLPSTPGEYHSKKHGKRFVMLFAEADRRMQKEYWQGVEWLDESRMAAGSEKPILTQSRADFIREVNDRDMDGLEAIEFAEWAPTIAFFDDEYRLWELLKEGEFINGQFRFTTKELYKLFKQQKDNP